MTVNAHARYTNIAIALHWVMAIAFLLMLTSGLSMEYITMSKSLKFNMYQWHKSLGVLLLMAFVFRIIWRLSHKAPDLPSSFSQWDIILAKVGHVALYICMIAVPLSGWLMVSSSVYGLPTVVFGWFEWPHIPGVAGNEWVSTMSKNAHWILAWSFGLCIAGHVAAVVKHIICDNENLLPRMWFGKRNQS
jgi:cytochrome b561